MNEGGCEGEVNTGWARGYKRGMSESLRQCKQLYAWKLKLTGGLLLKTHTVFA